MSSYLPIKVNASPHTQALFWGYATLLLVALGVGVVTEWYFLVGLPVLALLFFWTIVDYKSIFFLLIAFIPFSTEVYLPNGLGTDLPTEPLIVGLMLVYLLHLLGQPRRFDALFFLHPISLLLLLHLLWVFISTLTSSLWIVSLKFLLAKTWYIVVFYFLAGKVIRKVEDFKKFFWYFFLPLMFTVVVILIKHATYGFSFQDVYKVLHPFYRNHVAYAGIMALFFPIVVMAVKWYQKRSFRWWILVLSLPILLAAIYFSYTRAAYVSLFIALGAYVLFQLKAIRVALFGGLIVAILGITYMVYNNNYLAYAPNFDRTISHTEFDNLLEATYKMEDISTMERVYRWVAGFYMFSDKPVWGFGPGNFTNFYKSYTVTSFKTYVSRNEEKSGIHSYYLMVMVEQGIVGVLLFIALSFYVLIRGENIYHQTLSKEKRQIVMMMLLTTVVIDSFLIINDVVETDKFGALFFIAMAVLTNIDIQNRKLQKSGSRRD